MSYKIEPLITVDDLNLMPEDGNRYEVIEGELFVSRAPNLPHQKISDNLIVELKLYLRNNPIGEVWSTPGVIFSEIDGVIPDIAYVSKERLYEVINNSRLTKAPDLLIEIISSGTDNIRRDRVVKMQLYARYQVKEYWIVAPEEKIIEVYELQNRTFVLANKFNQTNKLTSSLLPNFNCSLETIFS
ncbi:MAG: hypothetical protein FD167_1367 [bacterium]|nr:MAG: hypothetical protein FD167_1367 [bacterium]